MNIDVNQKYPLKESDVLNNIISYLDEKEVEYDLQKYMDNYRLDMYLPEYFINIEVDENGHKDRCPLYEKERENIIKNNLCCDIIRFNPDNKNDNIFKFIARLECLINKNAKKNKELITKELKENQEFKNIFLNKFFEIAGAGVLNVQSCKVKWYITLIKLKILLNIHIP